MSHTCRGSQGYCGTSIRSTAQAGTGGVGGTGGTGGGRRGYRLIREKSRRNVLGATSSGVGVPLRGALLCASELEKGAFTR
ncbi:MAG: hypothetical protein QOF30_3365 [Acidimicrobiaceae bacterium]|nr:hypothetical protein [Acidimicrobiaceae bacterium]